jgi:glycosyl transferase family 25
MKVFARIINLDSRPDRWSLMQAFVKASRYNLQRFKAIKVPDTDAAKGLLSLRARADVRRERVQHEAISGLGAVGCAVSHFSVWTEFLQSDADVCLVLEDDLHPRGAPGLDSAVGSFLGRKDWDIGLLGWCSTLPARRMDGSITPFPSSAGFSGAQAYLLTRHAATTLTESFFPLEMQVDYAMQAIADAKGLRIVASSRPKLRQTLTGSDVFRVCLLCEPSLVYGVVMGLVTLVAVLVWKVWGKRGLA